MGETLQRPSDELPSLEHDTVAGDSEAVAERLNEYAVVVGQRAVHAAADDPPGEYDAFEDGLDDKTLRRIAEERGQILAADGVRAWLRKIGVIPLLNAEQEVQKATRYRAGARARSALAVREGALDYVALAEQQRNLVKGSYMGRNAPKTPAEKEYAEADIRRQVTEEVTVVRHLAENLDEDISDVELRLRVRDGDKAKNEMIEANLRLVVSVAKHYTGRGMAYLDLIQEGNVGLVRAVEKFNPDKGFKFSTYATWWIRQAVSRGLADQARLIRIPVHIFDRLNAMASHRRTLNRDLGREPTREELAVQMGVKPEDVEKLYEYMALEPRISLDEQVGIESGGLRGNAPSRGEFIADENTPEIADEAFQKDLSEKISEVLKTLPSREAAVLRMRYGLEGHEPESLEEIGNKYGLSKERIRQLEAMALRRLRHPSNMHTFYSYRDQRKY